jgi:hypothetical protein
MGRVFAGALVVLALAVVPGALGKPILGVTGNVDRFKAQTDQVSQVDQAFLGWGQGQTWGAPFNVLLKSLGPIPMLHLGTNGRGTRKAAISTSQIAAGAGDGYLAALNQALSQWGGPAYVRPMGEMNVPGVSWCCDTASYRKAFARIYVIVHGGPTVAANLKRLGLPAYRGPALQSNPFPRVRVLWSPLSNNVDYKPYWPGDRYVDVGGADIYKEASGDPPWAKFTEIYGFVRAHGKPFAAPEWGLYGIDYPQFVQDMCTFLKTHVVESEEFYASQPGSIFDLANKPKSREAYRSCITPLAAQLPSWAAGGAGSAKVVSLSLGPAAPGPDVTFPVTAQLTVPIAHWEIDFGDGAVASGSGQPPASVSHSYASGHAYEAVLVVFATAPFTPTAIVDFASAEVGGSAPPALVFQPSTVAGAAPLKVAFHLQSSLPKTVKGWTLVYGDGLSNTKTGPLPHFAGHTYSKPGTYDALLIANLGGSSRVIGTTTIKAG